MARAQRERGSSDGKSCPRRIYRRGLPVLQEKFQDLQERRSLSRAVLHILQDNHFLVAYNKKNNIFSGIY